MGKYQSIKDDESGEVLRKPPCASSDEHKDEGEEEAAVELLELEWEGMKPGGDLFPGPDALG